MQILLDATSESSKLLPLTESIPSPMMPILNRPVLLYPIELLARQGCKELLIGLHNFPGHIESFLGTGKRWGVSLNYILQQEAFGTGGMIKQARSFLQEPFVMLPADRIVDFDVEGLMAHHTRNGRIATAVVQQQGPANGRSFHVEQGNIVGVDADLTNENRFFETGIYLFEPEILHWIPENEHFDIYRQLVPTLLQAGEQIAAYVLNGFWNPLCTFDAYYETQMAFIKETQPEDAAQPTLLHSWQKGKEMATSIRVGRNHVIHPTVQLAAPVFIGENCYIGRDVELGPGTIVGSNVTIDDGATIAQSIIFDNTYIGRFVNLTQRLVQQSLVVDLPSGVSIDIEDHFLLGYTYQTVTETGLRTLFDKGVALVWLLLTSWLALLIGVLTWLTTGTVFVKEPRFHDSLTGSSKRSEPYFLYRFATRKRNGRLTSFGRFLHKYDLHRLPELWNVVTGDLMLVGVKPLTRQEVEKITEPWQQKRFENKPGITGLWYVQNGRFNELDEVLVADVYYVVTHSWQLDLKLLWQTPGGWWKKVRHHSQFPPP